MFFSVVASIMDFYEPDLSYGITENWHLTIVMPLKYIYVITDTVFCHFFHVILLSSKGHFQIDLH